MPTIRQKRALQKLSENLRSGEKKSIGSILRDAGYSKSVSEAPQVVTETKGWKELVKQYIPEDKILNRLSKNIDSKSDDSSNKAIDMAIKIHGGYAPEKIAISAAYESMSDKEIEEQLEEIKREKMKRLEIVK